MPQRAPSPAVEAVARALEPETFLLPRLNLYKADYDRDYAAAERAITAHLAALADAGMVVPAFPSDEMIEAGAAMKRQPLAQPSDIYRAMLSAHSGER
ncbi:hypothetical protein [Azospirillum sp. TSO22-1]|uniref:hypothetical protein n=1 Tax=Azospirillum sp. TSO22-1 TaxID=716789 RepID=UPI000D608C53|nr:hypothetical protein [Azospirillum sp. TSO22-1]PWC54630.1 hypothetical protein TSO221_08325 [Azospirillum sp. TSO22-1]